MSSGCTRAVVDAVFHVDVVHAIPTFAGEFQDPTDAGFKGTYIFSFSGSWMSRAHIVCSVPLLVTSRRNPEVATASPRP